MLSFTKIIQFQSVLRIVPHDNDMRGRAVPNMSP